MRLNAIIQRLEERLSWARKVQGAADLSRASERQQFGADLYVVDLGERAGANQRGNSHRQRVDINIGIFQWSRHVGDATGGKALEQLETRREQLLAALVNWAPSPEDDPFEFVEGRLVRFEPPGVLWSDRFKTTYQLVIPNE